MREASAAAALMAIFAVCGAQAQTKIPPPPKDFVMAASQSDQYEILAARDAVVQSHDQRIVSFAQTMITDHARLNEDLRRAAQASHLPPPDPGMSSDQASLLSGLQSLRGTEFDKAYARQQVLAHTQAVAVEQSFAKAGSDLNLRKAARTALPVITHHLDMAQHLSEEVGGS